MIYRRKLDIEIEEIRPELNIVRNASHELRSSARFRKVLQVLLNSCKLVPSTNMRTDCAGRWQCIERILFPRRCKRIPARRVGQGKFPVSSATTFTLKVLQLKETRTAKVTSSCPTLLHYIAKVLLTRDPNLVTFIEEMPHLEAAARGSLLFHIIQDSVSHSSVVSVQTIAASVQSLSAGLALVKAEVEYLQNTATSTDDRFVSVMQVSFHLSDLLALQLTVQSSRSSLQ